MMGLEHIKEDLKDVLIELSRLNCDVETVLPRHDGLLLPISVFKDSAQLLLSEVMANPTSLAAVTDLKARKCTVEDGLDVLKALVYKELDKNTDWEGA